MGSSSFSFRPIFFSQKELRSFPVLKTRYNAFRIPIEDSPMTFYCSRCKELWSFCSEYTLCWSESDWMSPVVTARIDITQTQAYLLYWMLCLSNLSHLSSLTNKTILSSLQACHYYLLVSVFWMPSVLTLNNTRSPLNSPRFSIDNNYFVQLR